MDVWSKQLHLTVQTLFRPQTSELPIAHFMQSLNLDPRIQNTSQLLTVLILQQSQLPALLQSQLLSTHSHLLELKKLSHFRLIKYGHQNFKPQDKISAEHLSNQPHRLASSMARSVKTSRQLLPPPAVRAITPFKWCHQFLLGVPLSIQ